MVTLRRWTGALATLALSTPAQVTWSNRGGIAPRTAVAMTFDAARRVVVLFGGIGSAGSEFGDTWEWDGRVWSQRFPRHQPPPRRGARMIFDTRRRVCLLVGGVKGDTALGDTWIWDGADWLALPAATVPPRGFHAMAYDSARDRTLLFGGDLGDARHNLGDTQEWDGSRWRRLLPANAPSPRYAAAMAYDSSRQRLVLSGGISYPKTSLLLHAECFEWDAASGAWVAATPAPASLRAHGMVGDPLGGGVLSFGSVNGRPELWRYDGATWQFLGGTAATAALSFGLAYDDSRDRLVLFGGSTLLLAQDATWEWDRSTWRRTGGGPLYSAGSRMVYDAARGAALLFSSTSPTSVSAWDGFGWQQVAATPAPLRTGAAFAYDRTRQRTVRFGGIDFANQQRTAETWTFDGVAWQLHAPNSAPPPTHNAALAFDEVRERIVLFGGQHLQGLSAQTWEWDGTDWARRLPATSPPPRENHAMTFDRRRGVVVMFTGSETWEWDGNDWRARSSTTRPPPTPTPSLAYDAARQRVVAYTASQTGEHWEWDGTEWLRRTAAIAPPPRTDTALAYDESRARTVLFGGASRQPERTYADTWELGAEVDASYVAIGAGCGGPGAEQLSAVADGRPWSGATFAVQVAPLPAGAAAGALATATSNSAWHGLALPFDLTPLGAPGCTLRVGLDLTVPLAVGGSSATAGLAVPAGRATLGLTLFQQALILAPSANSLGLRLSSARRLVIGTR